MSKISLYAPDQLEVLKIIYKDDHEILKPIKTIEKLYNKIDDNEVYSEKLKHIDFNYDKEHDLIYKVDFFNLEETHDYISNDNYFYSDKLFNDWLMKLESIKGYLQSIESLTNEEKRLLNMNVFEIKKELLNLIEIFKKREKENPFSAILGANIYDEEDDFMKLFENSLI